MKKIALIALTACTLLNVAPALALEQQEQYVCQLEAGSCVKEIDVVRRKMKKLEAETKKGKKVPPEELKKIEQKLKEVEDMIDKLKAK